MQITGVRHHVAIIIILELVDAVDIDLGHPPVAEQPLLVVHFVLVKTLDGLVRVHGTLPDRNLFLHQLPHPLFHVSKKLLRHAHVTLYRAVHALADGKVNPHAFHLVVAAHVVHRLDQQKAKTALVGVMPDFVRDGDKFQLSVLHKRLRKLLQTEIVDEHQHDTVPVHMLEILGDFLVCSSLLVRLCHVPHMDLVINIRHLNASFSLFEHSFHAIPPLGQPEW